MNYGYDLDFFVNWKQKTEQEKTYFRYLCVALKEITSAVPKLDLISVYLFGSYAQRKLSLRSDIDLRLIFRESYKYSDATRLKTTIYEKTGGKVNMGFYYEAEVKSGWFLDNARKGGRTPPKHFFKYLDSIISIYGKKPNQYCAPIVSDDEEFHWFCNRIRGFFKCIDYDGLYRAWSKPVQFEQILKQLHMMHRVQKRLHLDSDEFYKIGIFLEKNGLYVGAKDYDSKLEQMALSDTFWVEFEDSITRYIMSAEKEL